MATLVLQTVISIALNYALKALMSEGREGPRLQNLKLQTSEFGKFIPIGFGSNRFGGIVEWATGLMEHRNTSGGKGTGGGVTTFTYSASFSCKICEGPMAGLRRIWADNTLIWEAGGPIADMPDVPVTVYLGDDDQDVDPTMEAVLGVGNVSANRGYCYCVFTDWDLGLYGNRIPSLNFEVFSKGGPIPWRVSLFNAWPRPLNSSRLGVGYQDGFINTCSVFRDADGQAGFTFNKFDIHGTQIGSTVTTIVPYNSAAGFYSVRNLLTYLVLGPGPLDLQWWSLRTNKEAPDYGIAYPAQVMSPGSFNYPFRMQGNECLYQNDRIYYVDDNSTTTVMSWLNAAGGVPLDSYAFVYFTYDLHYASSNVAIGTSNTGHIYTMVGQENNCKLWKLDRDLNVLRFWPVSETNVTRLGVRSTNFHVYNNLIAYHLHAGTTDEKLALVKINGDGTLEDYGTTIAHDGFAVALGNTFYGIDQQGVYSLDPPQAAVILGTDVVAPISDRAGLPSSRYDVSQLPDPVDGYAIVNQDAARAAVNPLQSNWFFDAVESGGIVKFVKRGGPITVTIPDDDLAAHVTGSEDPPLITIKRQQEVDLPANLNVNFLNIDTDFQQDTQYARRTVTRSQMFVTLDLAITMNVQKAAQTAWTQLFALWIGRELPTILTSRKYWMYEPTDTMLARGYVFRVTEKQDVTAGVIQFGGVVTNSQTWVQGPTPAGGDGFVPTTPNALVASLLLLLDIPLIIDTDHDYGFYSAAGPNADVNWGGYTLFRSADGGGTYVQLGASSIRTVMGTTNDVLGVFGGGNTFDVINSVSVTIGLGGGDLESTAMDALLNGFGYYLIGDELVQVGTATEASPGVWTLSGPMLRGRRGTEWAMQFHNAGERVVFFPALDVDGALSDLGLSRLYKAVTQGMTIGSAVAQSFTNNGAGARPYSPVGVAGAPITPFDGTVQINWQRRTRKGGAWVDFVDVPVSESSERFIVQIWNSTYSLCARIITVDNAQTTTYSAADQVTDFGATQLNVYVTVGQLGAYKLGQQTGAIVPSLGATDDDPLAPVTPYNSTPSPPPSGGGGCTLTQINTLIDWNTSPYNVFAPGLSIDNVWVMSFVTPAAPVGGTSLGNLAAAEYSAPPALRGMTLSLSPCGPPLGGLTGSSGGGTAPIIWFCMTNNPDPATIPTLLPSTTYYVTVTSTAVSGMVASLSPPT